jgi:aspartate racemase
MSWESTLEYYKLINQYINQKLGGLHSGKIIVYSVDFEEIAKLQKEGNWKKSGEILGDAAKKLQNAGADFVLISTNTMHKVAEDVSKNIDIPLVDIRDVTIEAIKNDGIYKVLLLGTKFTMEDGFYVDYLKKHALEIVIPNEKERNYIHDVIFNKLCLGNVLQEDKKRFVEIIENSDAQGVVLGCTEIGMLISDEDVTKKVYDTTKLHAKKAADIMI